jgi:hypothetical protein
MIAARSQGLTFFSSEDGLEMENFDISDFFFDGNYLWDEKVLELTLKLHFPNAIDMKSMREDYGLVLGFHKMVPFIERYIDLAKKQRDNGTGDKVSIPFAECASRANQTRLTPNEAKSLMRRGGGTVRNK